MLLLWNVHGNKGKKTVRLEIFLTHFILLFNKANKMPGYLGTSHTCRGQIKKSAKPHYSSLQKQF